MDELIGAIIPLLIALGYLLNVFKKDDSNNKPTRQQTSKPQPTPAQTTRSEEVEPKNNAAPTSIKGEPEVETYYQKKQKEIDKIRTQLTEKNQTKEIQQGISIHDAIPDVPTPKTIKNDIKKENVSINSQLTRKGLAQSIIMAEVLGPPKAIKPHHNIISRRKYQK